MTTETEFAEPLQPALQSALQPALPYSHAGLLLEIAEACVKARSRPIRTMRQWAEEELIIPNGPKADERFRVENQPFLGLLLDEFDSGRWVEKYTTGPSQSAKTFGCWFIPIAYHIAELGEDVVAGVPDMRMADNKWQQDLLPAFLATPSLRRLLPTTGAGSAGGKVIDSIKFANGATLKFMSRSGSDQSKAGFTARVVAITEAAGFSKSTETSVEAEPLKQIEARQRAWDYPDRCTYVEGTLTVREQLPWQAREESSQSKIVSPCPHCGKWISPERSHLHGWKDAETELQAEEFSYWSCPVCEEKIDDQQRRASVLQCRILHGDQFIDKKGNVVGDLPPTRRLWFHWQAWHNMFVSTATLGREEWEAHRMAEDSPERESAERELCQFVHGMCYTPSNIDSADLDPKAVASRRDKLARGMIPADAKYVTVGIDLGKYLGWWFGLAFRECGKIHCFDFGSFDIHSDVKPTVEEAIFSSLVDFHSVCEVGWPIQGGTESRKPDQVWIDAGYQPDAVFRFVRSLGKHSPKSSRYFPIVGRGTGQMQRIYEAPKQVGGKIIQVGKRWHCSQVPKHRAYEIFVDSDHWKEELHNHLAIDKELPGSLNFFTASQRDLDRVARHLTNEKKMTEFVAGKGMVVKWVRVGQQHWLDGAYLARAAGDRCGWVPPSAASVAANSAAKPVGVPS